jgi:hypothetical protein
LVEVARGLAIGFDFELAPEQPRNELRAVIGKADKPYPKTPSCPSRSEAVGVMALSWKSTTTS